MGGGVGSGGRVGVRVDVNEELKLLRKFTKENSGGGGGPGRGGGGGQSECERRIEVFVKIPKKIGGGSGLGGRSRVGGSGWM